MYTAYSGSTVLGYAFIDTRIVRTLPGSFLIALSTTGTVKTVQVVAFHEPEDYLPPNRWLRQFEHKPLSPTLQVNKDIHGIAGATLSAQSVTNAVRQALALYHIILQPSQ